MRIGILSQGISKLPDGSGNHLPRRSIYVEFQREPLQESRAAIPQRALETSFVYHTDQHKASFGIEAEETGASAAPRGAITLTRGLEKVLGKK